MCSLNIESILLGYFIVTLKLEVTLKNTVSSKINLKKLKLKKNLIKNNLKLLKFSF